MMLFEDILAAEIRLESTFRDQLQFENIIF